MNPSRKLMSQLFFLLADTQAARWRSAQQNWDRVRHGYRTRLPTRPRRAPESRPIPCSDRFGIKAVWKRYKTKGNVESASVHRKKRRGSPAWIRTTIHGSKGRCPTIRRPGNDFQRTNYFSVSGSHYGATQFGKRADFVQRPTLECSRRFTCSASHYSWPLPCFSPLSSSPDSRLKRKRTLRIIRSPSNRRWSGLPAFPLL